MIHENCENKKAAEFLQRLFYYLMITIIVEA